MSLVQISQRYSTQAFSEVPPAATSGSSSFWVVTIPFSSSSCIPPAGYAAGVSDSASTCTGVLDPRDHHIRRRHTATARNLTLRLAGGALPAALKGSVTCTPHVPMSAPALRVGPRHRGLLYIATASSEYWYWQSGRPVPRNRPPAGSRDRPRIPSSGCCQPACRPGADIPVRYTQWDVRFVCQYQCSLRTHSELGCNRTFLASPYGRSSFAACSAVCNVSPYAAPGPMAPPADGNAEVPAPVVTPVLRPSLAPSLIVPPDATVLSASLRTDRATCLSGSPNSHAATAS